MVAFFNSLDIHFPPLSLFFSETPCSKIVHLLDVLNLNLLKLLFHGKPLPVLFTVVSLFFFVFFLFSQVKGEITANSYSWSSCRKLYSINDNLFLCLVFVGNIFPAWLLSFTFIIMFSFFIYKSF